MSDTTFNSESGGVADFMRVVSDNARLMHTIQAQKVRIAELEHERDEARAELLRRDAIWLPEKDAEIERLRAICAEAVEEHDTSPGVEYTVKERSLIERMRTALTREGE